MSSRLVHREFAFPGFLRRRRNTLRCLLLVVADDGEQVWGAASFGGMFAPDGPAVPSTTKLASDHRATHARA